MATNTKYTVDYRRVREGKTNYKTRLKLLLAHKARLVVRKTLHHIIVQIITYNQKGDRVIVTANSKQLAKHGWKASTSNTPAAYLTGLLAAKQALAKNIKECICDIGDSPSIPGNKLFAALAGAIDGGLSIPATKTVFPKEDRITGKHIATYAKTLKNKDEKKYRQQFAQYLKDNINPETLPEHFTQVKQKIHHD